MNIGDRIVSTETVCEVPPGTRGTLVQVFPRNLSFRYEVIFDTFPFPYLVTSKEISLAPN